MNWTLPTWGPFMTTGAHILAVLVLAAVALVVLQIVTGRLERSYGAAGPASGTLHEQRVKTLVGLVRGAGIVTILLVAFLMALAATGLNIAPILAGAGVVGLAISFGAQSLVRDLISGLFILFENQFGVGDVIRIGETGGLVEKLTLRVVVLRDVQGVVHVIPNGEIKQVSNMTRSWSRAVLEIPVAYREDVDHVIAVMRDIGAEMYDDPEWRPVLVEEIAVPGVEGFGDSSVNIRIMAKTIPLKQWDVGRELRRRIKKRFDAEGIQIPFPHRTLFWGEGQDPAGIGTGPAASAES